MAFDFGAVRAPFRMQPGLRRLLPGASQLTPNATDSRALQEKLRVLAHHPFQALVQAAGFDAGPALRALQNLARLEYPRAFSSDGPSHFHAHALGWSVQGDALVGDGPPAIGRCLEALPPPWRLAGLLSLSLAEDFAVIDGRSARIPWLAVCLPSRWAPEDKVGRHFAEVHAPVADNQLLIAAGEHLARLVTGDERWERFVWSIGTEARLAQHPDHVAPPEWPDGLDADALAAIAVFRTERQTFVPLPAMQQAVFTIHVETRPLTEAIASRDQALQLHDAFASMSPAVLAYRGLTSARERLLDWLRAR